MLNLTRMAQADPYTRLDALSEAYAKGSGARALNKAESYRDQREDKVRIPERTGVFERLVADYAEQIDAVIAMGPPPQPVPELRREWLGLCHRARRLVQMHARLLQDARALVRQGNPLMRDIEPRLQKQMRQLEDLVASLESFHKNDLATLSTASARRLRENSPPMASSELRELAVRVLADTKARVDEDVEGWADHLALSSAGMHD